MEVLETRQDRLRTWWQSLCIKVNQQKVKPFRTKLFAAN